MSCPESFCSALAARRPRSPEERQNATGAARSEAYPARRELPTSTSRRTVRRTNLAGGGRTTRRLRLCRSPDQVPHGDRQLRGQLQGFAPVRGPLARDRHGLSGLSAFPAITGRGGGGPNAAARRVITWRKACHLGASFTGCIVGILREKCLLSTAPTEAPRCPPCSALTLRRPRPPSSRAACSDATQARGSRGVGREGREGGAGEEARWDSRSGRRARLCISWGRQSSGLSGAAAATRLRAAYSSRTDLVALPPCCPTERTRRGGITPPRGRAKA